MSQSTTLYRVSKDKFSELETSGSFDPSLAKNYVTLEGSFMALEFILSKNQDDETADLVKELFNPGHSIGGQHFDLDDLESFEEFDLSDTPISYLDIATIGNIHNILDNISTTELEDLYDSEELNSNGIYPEVWHDDNSPDQGFNLRQVSEDFVELKAMVKQAKEEGDYVVVFGG
jgi:uncharacterized protein DUF1877